MKNDIFISYKSEEFEIASLIRSILEANHLSCWMAPQSIPGGSSYAEEINSAISECSVFVLILSEKAQQSKWISKEIDIALNTNKRVMTVLIEDCNITGAFNYYLTDVQRYNAYENMSSALKKLIREVHEHLGHKISYVPDFASISIGDTVEFGNYIQGSALIKSELVWRVIDKVDDEVLLLSEKCIELKPYNFDKNSDTTWETCSLRKWLNTSFLSTAFDEEELSCILTSNLSAEPNSEHLTPGGNDTQDKVFILSACQAEKYLINDGERIALATEQVLLQDSGETSGPINWWLRTPGYYGYRAVVVSQDGRIDYDGYSASRGNIAVRPAIWVKNT